MPDPRMFSRGDFVGGYRLVRELGRGGFSMVWRARLPGAREDVALKLITDPEHASQVAAELRARAVVPSFGVVPILAHGVDGDTPWLALELQRTDLRRKLAQAKSGRLVPAQIAPVIRRILRTLAGAHARGLVHGDLKPENILYGTGHDVLLADFGLSTEVARRKAALSLSRSLADARFVGTVAYAAPEVRRGDAPTPRSDVYSAGVLFYELLVGVRPEGRFLLPGAIPDRLPTTPAVDAVIARALAPDPAARFANAGAMLHALKVGVADEARLVHDLLFRQRPGAELAVSERPGCLTALGLLVLAMGGIAFVANLAVALGPGPERATVAIGAGLLLAAHLMPRPRNPGWSYEPGLRELAPSIRQWEVGLRP